MLLAVSGYASDYKVILDLFTPYSISGSKEITYSFEIDHGFTAVPRVLFNN